MERRIDGDTFVANLSRDVGFNCRPTWRWRLRVSGIDCPEMRGASRVLGQAAREFAEAWLTAEPVAAETLLQDSFGRWVAIIRRADGVLLADALVAAGHAVPWAKG